MRLDHALLALPLWSGVEDTITLDARHERLGPK